MEYKELAEKLRSAKWTNTGMTDDQSSEWDASDAITDLLARAEAAEARCKLAEKCFDDSALHACETQLELEKKAREEAEARAAKAEKCIAEIEDALKFGRYSTAMLRISEYRGEKEE